MKDKRTWVSAVVPMYNVEKFIERCIRSLLCQTYKDIEIIAISDGSVDRSVEICRELQKQDNRIHIIEKENGGVSSARNAGIRCATGDFLMFVDGDDWLEPNTVEIMLHTLQDNKTDACFSNCYYRNERDVVTATRCNAVRNIASCELIEKQLRYQFLASACLTLVRLNKVKPCLFDESIHTLEDWEYNFRMLTCIDNASIIDIPLYHYREVIGSASKSKLNARKMSCFLIPPKVIEHIKEQNLPYEKLVDYTWVFLLNHMLVLLANNEYADREANALRLIARERLKYALTADVVPLKQRIYTLMCAISPKIYCAFYHAKHLWRE